MGVDNGFMPTREFRVTLSSDSHVSIEFLTFKGEVVCFVVRLMTQSENGNVCVARYDTAHGRPHLDKVNKHGRLLQKEWLLGMSFSEALCYAISDFRTNYETYISEFKKASSSEG
jgi:hypothetical protein